MPLVFCNIRTTRYFHCTLVLNELFGVVSKGFAETPELMLFVDRG